MKLTLAFLLAAVSADLAAKPVATFTQSDDHELAAARTKARASLSDFLAVLDKRSTDTGGYQVRFALTPTEHIWVENLSRVGSPGTELEFAL